MLKILQASLHQYMNHELPDVQAEFRKGRGTKNQIANIHWKIKKVREFHKSIYFMDRGAWRAAVHGVAKSRTRLSDFAFTFTFCSIDYAKAFDCVDNN